MAGSSTAVHPSPARSRGRPRCEGIRQLVRSAAREMLEEGTFQDFSIEAVSARTGVAKTTIYRWWRSKAELAVDAFLDAVDAKVPFPADDAMPVRERFRVVLRRLSRLYRGPVGRFMRSVASAALADEQVRAVWWDRFFAVRRAVVAQRLREAAEGGEIRGDCDPETTMDSLFGPLIYSLFLRGRPPSDRQMDLLVDRVFSHLEVASKAGESGKS